MEILNDQITGVMNPKLKATKLRIVNTKDRISEEDIKEFEKDGWKMRTSNTGHADGTYSHTMVQ